MPSAGQLAWLLFALCAHATDGDSVEEATAISDIAPLEQTPSVLRLGEDSTHEMGRRGGGLAAAGSFMLISAGNRAGNDEALLDTLGEGMDLRGGDKTKKMTNGAKCAGSKQDHSSTEGLLDCESDPYKGKESNKGTSCLDNLSSGSYYAPGTSGVGFCKGFGTAQAYSHTTMYTSQPGSPREGVITKGWVVHPHKSSLNSGAFGMKRLKCQGTKCTMYKLGYCVKCPKPIFKHKEDFLAKPAEFDVFINCCVMGKTKYKTMFGTKEKGNKSTELGEGGVLKTTEVKCPAGFGTGAFTKTNDASATLKPEYECEESDATLHEVLLKAK